MDEFERSKIRNDRLRRYYAFQTKLLPKLVFWGLVGMLAVGIMMIGFGIWQAINLNHEEQLRNNILFAPVFATQIVWLLLSRFSPKHLPVPMLLLSLSALVLAPIVSGLVSGPAEWEFYLISYVFTLFSIFAAPLAFFLLRSQSQFSYEKAEKV